ncbi:YraN family protein [Salinactinospora qingdaonensis]|uniref:YraN family protein n=1 Tax=Salinactinospora qingdaonensis TaxID=702744 RepID=UPI0031EC692D
MAHPTTPRWAQTLGRRGEEIAAGYLREEGMRILARNWRCRDGEIDIVARWGATLVVAEVKTRACTRFGSPLEAVTVAKRTRLRRLARNWSAAQRRPVPQRVRVDVVSVLLARDGCWYVNHHRGVA